MVPIFGLAIHQIWILDKMIGAVLTVVQPLAGASFEICLDLKSHWAEISAWMRIAEYSLGSW